MLRRASLTKFDGLCSWNLSFLLRFQHSEEMYDPEMYRHPITDYYNPYVLDAEIQAGEFNSDSLRIELPVWLFVHLSQEIFQCFWRFLVYSGRHKKRAQLEHTGSGCREHRKQMPSLSSAVDIDQLSPPWGFVDRGALHSLLISSFG